MAILAPTLLSPAGGKVPFVDVGVAGDHVTATGAGTILVEFRNAGGAERTVTLDAPTISVNDPRYGILTKPDAQLVLAAGEEAVFLIDKPAGQADPATGRVAFNYSAADELKIRALRVV